MRKLVILRPEPGASATLARAIEAGLDAVAIPLFEVRPVEWTAPDAEAFDAVLLTSANAARHGGAGLQPLLDKLTYCVGEATAAAAYDAGFTNIGVGGGDSAAMVKVIPEGKRLLHLAGRDRHSVAGATAVTVYDSVAIDPPPALDALNGGVAMVYSPRAGRRLAELVADRGGIAIAAISAAAAEACGSGWDEVAVAERPDDLALLAIAAELCQNRER